MQCEARLAAATLSHQQKRHRCLPPSTLTLWTHAGLPLFYGTPPLCLLAEVISGGVGGGVGWGGGILRRDTSIGQQDRYSYGIMAFMSPVAKPPEDPVLRQSADLFEVQADSHSQNGFFSPQTTMTTINIHHGAIKHEFSRFPPQRYVFHDVGRACTRGRPGAWPIAERSADRTTH